MIFTEYLFTMFWSVCKQALKEIYPQEHQQIHFISWETICKLHLLEESHQFNVESDILHIQKKNGKSNFLETWDLNKLMDLGIQAPLCTQSAYSIGFRSGDCEGQANTGIWFFSRKFRTALGLCGRALSCIRQRPGSAFSVNCRATDWRM